MNLGLVPYDEAWELQRSLAAAVSQGAIPDTVVLLEHPPTITIGRRTEEGELHIPEGADVEVVETDRGGKSTYHGPGPARLLPDPRPEPARPGREALLPRPRGGDRSATLATFGVEASGSRGSPASGCTPAAAEDRLDRRPPLALGDDARLRAQRRPRPGAVHGLDHGLRARGRGVHDDRARARAAGRRSTRCARPRSTRSPRCSSSSSRSCRPTARRPLGAAGARAARRALSGFGVIPTIRVSDMAEALAIDLGPLEFTLERSGDGNSAAAGEPG